MAKSNELGLVQVYTGDGKGKTTAALGLAMRAVGQGFRVGFLQFLKGYARSGEHLLLRKQPFFAIVQPAAGSVFRQPVERRRANAQAALELARAMLDGGQYDLVVLDEAITAVKIGALRASEVLELVRRKPPQVELVLTGRGASPEILAAADLVTEMVPLRHPYEKGIKARRGVEY